MSTLAQTTLPIPLNTFSAHQSLFATTTTTPQPCALPTPNPTRSFWLNPPPSSHSHEVNPLAKAGSTGPLTSDADICIIGSGITGVSAAYHLSKTLVDFNKKEPVKIVLLDARDFCSGATGRNGGHLTSNVFIDFSAYSLKNSVSQALKALALEHHTTSSLLHIIKSNKLEEEVDLVEGGHFDSFFTNEELESSRKDYDAAKEAGVNLEDVTWFKGGEMLEKYGTNYPSVRVPGNNLWPLKLVTALYHLAHAHLSTLSSAGEESSLHLHTNTPVESITPYSPSSTSATSSNQNILQKRWTLHTPRGVIHTRTVLHCTNAYASHLLPFLAGPSGIIPVRGQVVATRASVSSEQLGGVESWAGNEGFEYWFPRPAAKEEKPLIILGGGREANPTFELYVSDDSVVNETTGTALRKFLPTVYPDKFENESEPEMEWTGIMGFTSSRDPFVGPVYDLSSSIKEELVGQYISAGYTGHGMPRAFGCAEAVSSLIVHDLLHGKPREKWVAPDWLPKTYLTWNRL